MNARDVKKGMREARSGERSNSSRYEEGVNKVRRGRVAGTLKGLKTGREKVH